MTDTLGFLIADVSRQMRRRFDQHARRVGATGAQWKTLLAVSRHEGINQGGLAELLEVEPITLCRMIDRLEDSGLVERRRDPADRRAWQIFLTDAAAPVLERLRAHADAIFDTAFNGLDAGAKAQLADALGRIRDNLQAEPKEVAHG
jgi:DNA-binding MarR family transcriptional regulator